jgi:hypothetical protein
MAGRSEWRQAKQLDAEPELVTLRQLADGGVGDDIPSFRGATQWFLWAGLCVAGSLASFVYTFAFHLDVFGRRKASSSLTLDTRPVNSPKIKNSEAQLIGAHAEYFLAREFQSLGCVDCNMLGSTSRIALFLSPDGFGLLSLILEKGHANPTLMGIACDGSCFSIGRGRERVEIDGTAAGIPLIVNSFPAITDEQILRGFDVLKESLAGGGELAKIDPASALALVHYRVLLKAWWALLHSASHLTPDPLPDRTEIFRSERGVTTFCWGSNDTPPQSRGKAASCDSPAGAGAW